MGKRVLISTGSVRVFGGLEEAAGALGVTPVAVSKAIKEDRECQGVRLRWAERVYAVKTKDGVWHLAGMSSDNRRYVLLDDMGGTVKKSDVEKVKDITAGWHGI